MMTGTKMKTKEIEKKNEFERYSSKELSGLGNVVRQPKINFKFSNQEQSNLIMSRHVIVYIMNALPSIYVREGVTIEINYNSQVLRDLKIVDSQ